MDTAGQSLGETLPITGTPYNLVYQSGKNISLRPNVLDIQLTKNVLDPKLRAIELSIDIAGNRHFQVFTPSPNQHYTYTWNGLDAYGRNVPSARAKIRLGYVYPYTYGSTDRDAYLVHRYPDNNSTYVYRLTLREKRDKV